MNWIDIGPLEAIPLRGARRVRTPHGCIAVFRTDADEVFATASACPHRGGPLEEGIVHGARVTCPLHNWVFDLATGQAVDEDARIDTFPVRIAAGRVLIDLTRLSDRAA